MTGLDKTTLLQRKMHILQHNKSLIVTARNDNYKTFDEFEFRREILLIFVVPNA